MSIQEAGLGAETERPAEQASQRLREIDALRGFALCGILLVNIVDVTDMPTGCAGSTGGFACRIFEVTLYHRFYIIFSLLFGISSALFLESVKGRSAHPRLVLLARFGFLIPFGVVHSLLQPGEVLLIYAILGVVILLPASFLPRFLILLLAVLAIVVAAAIPADGTLTLIPGMFLLGLATGLYGLPRRLASHRRVIWILFCAGCPLALALDVVQIHLSAAPESSLSTMAGLVTAAAYSSGLLLLLGTRARRSLSFLEPLGRMALTNYIAATVMIVLANQVLNLADEPSYETVVLLGIAILFIQSAFSMFWVKHFRYGPLEWLWRCMTWWRWVPNRILREDVSNPK